MPYKKIAFVLLAVALIWALLSAAVRADDEGCTPIEQHKAGVRKHPAYESDSDFTPVEFKNAIGWVTEESDEEPPEVDGGYFTLLHNGVGLFWVGHDGQICRVFVIPPHMVKDFFRAAQGVRADMS